MTTGEGYDEIVEKLREQMRTRTGRKLKAQEMLLHGIATVLGYWTESDQLLADTMTADEITEFSQLLRAQADRVARMFGYDEAWSS